MKFLLSISKELRAFVVLLAIFFLLGQGLTWLDPNAGTIDIGWLQVLAAGLQKAAFQLVGVWLLLETAFPTFRDYTNLSRFRDDFNSLPGEARLKWFLTMFCAVLAFVAISFHQ